MIPKPEISLHRSQHSSIDSGHTVHIFTRSTQARTWENEIMGVIYHEVPLVVPGSLTVNIANVVGRQENIGGILKHHQYTISVYY